LFGYKFYFFVPDNKIVNIQAVSFAVTITEIISAHQPCKNRDHNQKKTYRIGCVSLYNLHDNNILPTVLL